MVQVASAHPIQQLAAAHLKDRGIVHLPGIHPGILHDAMARYGTGPDHPAGEQPLAYLDLDLPRGFTASYVVSDRRLFGRIRASNIPDTFYDIPFPYVTDVKVEGSFLTKKLSVAYGPGVAKLPLFVDPLEKFFRGVLSLPPAYRSFPPLAVDRSPEDPSGAMNANGRLVARDPRASVLLRTVYEGCRAGRLHHGEGFELVMRTLVLDRTVAMGRGARQGTWLTLVPRADLIAAFPALLGAPVGTWRDAASDTGDFVLERAGSSGAGALASSAVGLALFAAVGVGWVSVARSAPQVRVVRVVLTDMPPVAGVTLLGSPSGAQFQPLSVGAPSIVGAISQALLGIESRLLLLQAAFGLAAPTSELLAMPRADVERRLAELVGPIDVGAFFAK